VILVNRNRHQLKGKASSSAVSAGDSLNME
jgi:hypothetical protein